MHSTFPNTPVAWVPFVVVGSLCVIAGGLVAAVTATVPSEHGAWAAAYLVLVAGVAQVALGLGQAWLVRTPPTPRNVPAEFAAFNLGNAAVLTGELSGYLWLVDAGGVLLVVALVLFLLAAGRQRGDRVLLAYRVLIAIVLVSIPVGLVLARIGD